MYFVKAIFLFNVILLYRALTNAASSGLVSYTLANVVGTARVHTNFKPFMTAKIL